jgi:hypothetical protein
MPPTGHYDRKTGNDATLEELWDSDRHVERVRDLADGHREKFALCRNCPIPPSAPAPAGKHITISQRNSV